MFKQTTLTKPVGPLTAAERELRDEGAAIAARFLENELNSSRDDAAEIGHLCIRALFDDTFSASNRLGAFYARAVRMGQLAYSRSNPSTVLRNGFESEYLAPMIEKMGYRSRLRIRCALDDERLSRPYTLEELADGRYALADAELLFGVHFQVQAFSSVGYASSLRCTTELRLAPNGIDANSVERLPGFEALKEALAWMQANRVHGMVQSYLLDKFGRRSWCTSGIHEQVGVTRVNGCPCCPGGDPQWGLDPSG